MRARTDALVDEGDDHRALADRCGDALGRSAPRVTDRVDPGDARLEDPVGPGRVARQDESVLVANDRVPEPVRMRLGAEEQEEVLERQPLVVGQRDRAELAVFAMELGDLASVAHLNSSLAEVADQVVGHRLAEIGPAVKQGDEGAAPREPDRGLSRRVSPAHDRDLVAAAPACLGRSGRVEDADPLVAVEPFDRKPAVLSTVREDHGARRDLVAVLEAKNMVLSARLERGGDVRGRRSRAEFPGLRDGAAGQVRARDASGKAEVVLDAPREAGLSTEDAALDDERVESLRRAVDGRAQPGGTAAQHHEVPPLARAQLPPDPAREQYHAAVVSLHMGGPRDPDYRQAFGRKATDQPL